MVGWRSVRGSAWVGALVVSVACTGDPASMSSTSGATSTSTGQAVDEGTDAAVTSSGGHQATAGDTTGSSGDSSGTTAGTPSGPVQIVTITMATASEDEPLADASPVQLCLNETTCLAMDRPHRDDAGKREAGPLQAAAVAGEGVVQPPACGDDSAVRRLGGQGVAGAEGGEPIDGRAQRGGIDGIEPGLHRLGGRAARKTRCRDHARARRGRRDGSFGGTARDREHPGRAQDHSSHCRG